MKLLSVVCWSIWRGRNELVWNQKYDSVGEVVALARAILCAQNRTPIASQEYVYPGDGCEHWTKPATNTIKINVDAAIFEESTRYGYAWVARNSEGSLVEAKVIGKHGRVNPEVAEIIGVKEALSWLKQKWL